MSHLDRNYGESTLDVQLRFSQHLADRAYARSRFEPPTQEQVDAELARRNKTPNAATGIPAIRQAKHKRDWRIELWH